jgi:cardiolipin synthase
MPHVPDKLYAYLLSRTYYRELLEHGVKIYEYIPGFVHAKLFVSDGIRASVGSINLDFRSMYLHFECAAYMYENCVAQDIEQDFQYTLSKCEQITLESCDRYPKVKTLVGKVLRLFAPLM